MHTWLNAFAEDEQRPVPSPAQRKVLRFMAPGAMAYPAISVITTRPTEKMEIILLHLTKKHSQYYVNYQYM